MGVSAQALWRKVGDLLTGYIKTLMNTNTKIYVAGHRGMVGSAIVRNLVGIYQYCHEDAC
jgi:hypothetical protein